MIMPYLKLLMDAQTTMQLIQAIYGRINGVFSTELRDGSMGYRLKSRARPAHINLSD